MDDDIPHVKETGTAGGGPREAPESESGAQDVGEYFHDQPFPEAVPTTDATFEIVRLSDPDDEDGLS